MFHTLYYCSHTKLVKNRKKNKKPCLISRWSKYDYSIAYISYIYVVHHQQRIIAESFNIIYGRSEIVKDWGDQIKRIQKGVTMAEKSILKLETVRNTSVQNLVSIVRRFTCWLLICGIIGIIMSKMYLMNISVVLGGPCNSIIMAVPMIIHLGYKNTTFIRLRRIKINLTEQLHNQIRLGVNMIFERAAILPNKSLYWKNV